MCIYIINAVCVCALHMHKTIEHFKMFENDNDIDNDNGNDDNINVIYGRACAGK